MRVSFWVTAATLLAVAFAGCVDSDDALTADEQQTAEYRAGFTEGTWPSGQVARDYIESYVMTHPFRASQPQYEEYMEEGRDSLQALMEGFGLTVERHEYVTTSNPAPQDPEATEQQTPGVNILGFQYGTVNPDQWVVLSAHYDTASNVDGGIGPTVYGAWDDGAGVASLLALGEAFQDWEFPFTVVYAMFDQEEEGLVGSRVFVNEYLEEHPEIDVLANINTDPPGLNWPCGDQAGYFPVKIIEETAKLDNASIPRYGWLHEGVEAGLNNTGVPEENLDRTAGIPVATAAGQGVRGSSDHVSFGRNNIANVYVGGLPSTIVNGDPNDHTAGVLTYGLHTPLDTLQQMEARCTVGTLSDGLQTTVDIFAHMLTHLSNDVPPAF